MGLLHVSNLGADYFQFVPEQLSLVGDKTGLRYQLGQQLEVILAGVDVEARKIDLLPVQSTSSARTQNKRRKNRRGKR